MNNFLQIPALVIALALTACGGSTENSTEDRADSNGFSAAANTTGSGITSASDPVVPIAPYASPTAPSPRAVW